MRRKIPNPSGRFGRLVILSKTPLKENRSIKMFCKCDCGTEILVLKSSLLCGETKSCGCLRKDVSSRRLFKHGKSGTITYQSWDHMVSRCTDTDNDSFKNYGGRGITVCVEWLNFKNFLRDMGERPSLDYSIGRIDNDGNYEPRNCRWETRSQQCNNSRNNHVVSIDGITTNITTISKEYGLNPSTVFGRISRGWSIERAVKTPLHPRKPKSNSALPDYTETQRPDGVQTAA